MEIKFSTTGARKFGVGRYAKLSIAKRPTDPSIPYFGALIVLNSIP